MWHKKILHANSTIKLKHKNKPTKSEMYKLVSKS